MAYQFIIRCGLTFLVALGLSACSGSGKAPDAAQVVVAPPATNASASHPSISKQTNLSAAAQTPSGITLQTVAQNLPAPWGLAFLPDGRMLVSSKAGAFLVLNTKGEIEHTIKTGLPANLVEVGQGGLLDVVLDKDFAQNRRIYFCFAERDTTDASRNGTALASAQLAADDSQLQNTKVLYRQLPKMASGGHFGCRIVQAGDKLYMGMGDRQTNANRVLAQDLSKGHGKIIRINTDGSVPADNSFVNTPNAQREIWSYGHRNIQGATLAADGKLWISEHGPQGGDEINIAAAGKNYGWPVITHGEEYGGGQLGEGSAKAGMEQPLKYWVPSIAPAGLTFLASDKYGNWQGQLFSGALRGMSVRGMTVQGDRITAEHTINIGERVRDVRQGPDGYLYVLTDGDGAKILRLMPQW